MQCDAFHAIIVHSPPLKRQQPSDNCVHIYVVAGWQGRMMQLRMISLRLVDKNTYVFFIDVREQVQIVNANGTLEWIEQGTLLNPIGGPNGYIRFGRMPGSRSCHNQRELLRNKHLGLHDDDWVLGLF